MKNTWLRRAALALAGASIALLSACGSGSVESQLTPARVVVFGDAMADVGNNLTRYTVNDSTVSTWVEELAIDYNTGLKILPSDQGGTGWARGNARIVQTPDAAGNASTLTVAQQIDGFLAHDTIANNDLAIVNAGTSDLVVQMSAVLAGAQTLEQMNANAQQAGRDMAAQVRRLVEAGATHVLVVGPYNLGRSLWAGQINQADALGNASLAFNNGLLLAIVDLGANVLYVDAQYYYNLVISTPNGYNLSNATDAACGSIDPGPGIGIGSGKVNSALCTPANVVVGVDYNKYVFADALYFTPQPNRLFGDYVYNRVKARF